MIIWLTGESGAGKTTLAKKYCKKHNNWIMLDGDQMRASISVGAGFSKKDRREHNLRVARLAKILERQGFDIMVSVIAPMENVRNKIDSICRPEWIYIKKDLPKRKGHFYEAPRSNIFIIDTDVYKKNEAYKMLDDYIRRFL